MPSACATFGFTAISKRVGCPDHAIEPLRRAVEFSDTPQGTQVADLLGFIQVFISRTGDNLWMEPFGQLEDRMPNV